MGDDGGDHALDNAEYRQHQVQAIGHCRLCQGKADKQLEGVFRALQIGHAGTGLDYTNCEEQHQQPKANGFQRIVDVEHDAPNPTAFEGGGVLGEQGPDFGQLVVPCFQRRIQVIYDPVSGWSPPSEKIGGSAPVDAPAAGTQKLRP